MTKKMLVFGIGLLIVIGVAINGLYSLIFQPPRLILTADPVTGTAPVAVTVKAHLSAGRWWSYQLYCGGTTFDAGDGYGTATNGLCTPYNLFRDFKPVEEDFSIGPPYIYERAGNYTVRYAVGGYSAETSIHVK